MIHLQYRSKTVPIKRYFFLLILVKFEWRAQIASPRIRICHGVVETNQGDLQCVTRLMKQPYDPLSSTTSNNTCCLLFYFGLFLASHTPLSMATAMRCQTTNTKLM